MQTAPGRLLRCRQIAKNGNMFFPSAAVLGGGPGERSYHCSSLTNEPTVLANDDWDHLGRFSMPLLSTIVFRCFFVAGSSQSQGGVSVLLHAQVSVMSSRASRRLSSPTRKARARRAMSSRQGSSAKQPNASSGQPVSTPPSPPSLGGSQSGPLASLAL